MFGVRGCEHVRPSVFLPSKLPQPTFSLAGMSTRELFRCVMVPASPENIGFRLAGAKLFRDVSLSTSYCWYVTDRVKSGASSSMLGHSLRHLLPIRKRS